MYKYIYIYPTQRLRLNAHAYHKMLLYVPIYNQYYMRVQDYNYYGVHKKFNLPDSVLRFNLILSTFLHRYCGDSAYNNYYQVLFYMYIIIYAIIIVYRYIMQHNIQYILKRTIIRVQPKCTKSRALQYTNNTKI